MNEFDFRKQLVMSSGVSTARDIADLLVEQIPGALKVIKANQRDDKSGTDYWIEHARGTPISVDTKVRGIDPIETYKRDDLALETWSVIGEKIGWTLDETKRTDFILWWFTPTRRWVLVPFIQLQAVFKRRRDLWCSKFRIDKQRTAANGNRGAWHSECVFVPREVVWNAIYEDFGGLPSHTKQRHGLERVPAKTPGLFELKSWTWTCLSCNAVGDSAVTRAAHQCTPLPYARDFWIKRLQFIGRTRDEVAGLISVPIDRTQLVEWLGWQWEPRACSKCGQQAVIASTPYDTTLPNNGRPDPVTCGKCSKPDEARA